MSKYFWESHYTNISSDTAITFRELTLKATLRTFFFSLKLELEMELKYPKNLFNIPYSQVTLIICQTCLICLIDRW